MEFDAVSSVRGHQSGEIFFGYRLPESGRKNEPILPPQAAEYYFERHVIFMISLREIMKMTCLSKDNLA